MFIDSVVINIQSGKGGKGASSFRREKFISKGGPDGGDGGNGGDIYFVADTNAHTLSSFRGAKTIKAENGKNGSKKKRNGKNGAPLVIKVPLGTQIIDIETKDILVDIIKDDQKVKILEGGRGGLGNWHFRNSANQKPTYSQPGEDAKSLKIKIELKLIADVALVGFPNAGKSTLVSTISNTKPQIANYEFTTLVPNLGVVDVGDFNSFVVADIPGIIRDASLGKGLGIKFLKHVERTKLLLFMLDISSFRDISNQYKIIKSEVKKFSTELSSKPFAIAITKTDMLKPKELKNKISKFVDKAKLRKLNGTNQDSLRINKNMPLFLIDISAATNSNIDKLKYMLFNFLKITNQ